MDSPCIKQTVCKVLKIFQYGKYLVEYVLKMLSMKIFFQILFVWQETGLVFNSEKQKKIALYKTTT